MSARNLGLSQPLAELPAQHRRRPEPPTSNTMTNAPIQGERPLLPTM